MAKTAYDYNLNRKGPGPNFSAISGALSPWFKIVEQQNFWHDYENNTGVKARYPYRTYKNTDLEKQVDFLAEVIGSFL